MPAVLAYRNVLHAAAKASVDRIIIFEPHAGGHTMHHVKWIIEAIRERTNTEIDIVTTEKAMADPSSSAVVKMAAHGLNLCYVKPVFEHFGYLRRLHPVLQQQFVYSETLANYLKAEYRAPACRHLFIPFFDAYALWPLTVNPGSFKGFKVSGIVHRAKHHFPAMGIAGDLKIHSKLERIAYRTILRRKDPVQLFTVDPFLAQYWNTPRLKFVPDPADFAPTEERATFRSRLGIPDDKMLVLVFGYIDKRKALDTLLSALQNEACSSVTVLVAGHQGDEVQALLRSPASRQLKQRGQLLEIPRFLEENEVHNAFAAADMIWACYSNSDGNSGVLVRAGRAQRAAIVSLVGTTAKLVSDYGAGWTADASSPQSVAAALSEAASNAHIRMQRALALAKVFQDHTKPNYLTPMVEYITTA